MAFDGREIANFVLDFCDNKNVSITQLSLQKIVFFCHAWSLVKLGKPLVKQQFEAWEHGPVLQYLHREFKSYKDQPIVSRAQKLNPYTGEKVIAEYEFDAQTQDLLEQVVAFYCPLSVYQLVELTHVRGGPWDKVWHHGGRVNPGMKIDNEDIANFYSSISASNVTQ